MALEIERAAYSRTALKECLAKIKSINWTVQIKAQHLWKCLSEVKEVYDFCYEKTNCCLFDPYWSFIWGQYHDLICEDAERGERRVRHTKKEMDEALRKCHRDLIHTVESIIYDLDTGALDESI